MMSLVKMYQTKIKISKYVPEINMCKLLFGLTLSATVESSGSISQNIQSNMEANLNNPFVPPPLYTANDFTSFNSCYLPKAKIEASEHQS